MSDLLPQSVRSDGVITAVSADGVCHHFHTDDDEARRFTAVAMALAAGKDELFLLLYSADSPQHLLLRSEDGRSDAQLKDDWLSKVCAAGMPKASGLTFLTSRLACK